MITNIKKTFLDRNLWQNNRTSAVFPCYINKKNDQIICFQNYWSWKNNIDDVNLILRICDEKGKIEKIKRLKIKPHNVISIKKIFRVRQFKGLIECQFFSSKNLKFPYPAIYCFFRNKNNCISVVHSAGRIQNFTEKKISQNFEESNFYCIYDNEFEPFMHFFNGVKKNKNKTFEVKIYNFDNKLILKKKYKLKLSKPFQSKILFLSDIFNEKELNKVKNINFFIRIKRKVFGIFGRVVAGNYNKKFDAFFTTHSLSTFDKKNFLDLVNLNYKHKSSVFLTLNNSKPLSLKSVCYPINQNFKARFDVKSAISNNVIYKNSGKKINIENNEKSKVFNMSLNNSVSKLLHSRKKLPGRIYISLNYKLKNSKHPTDIGTSFHNIYTPLKTNHWGQGVSRKNFNTIFFIRNISHLKSKTPDAKCTFELFNNKRKISRKFLVKGESSFTKIEKNLNTTLKSEYYSWKINSDQKNLDVIWVSYNEKTGEVCGDHSF